MPPRQPPATAASLDESASASWSPEWEVGMRVWIERDGQTLLSQELADLLLAIETTSSISAAARRIGISYRHAWKLVHEGNLVAGEPLVTAAVGGVKGGGAALTPQGRLALQVFQRVRGKVRATAAELLQKSIRRAGDVATTLHLAAAVSLQEVMAQLLTEFALRRPGIRVRSIFGPSNELAEHIVAGAPIDVVVFASPAEVKQLAAHRKLLAKSTRVVAASGLVVVGRTGSPPLKNLAAVGTPQVGRVALAEPACPLGRYSRVVLEAAGVVDEIAAKAVSVDNSRAVLTAVESRAADVGIVYASDPAQRPALEVLYAISRTVASVEYVAGVTAEAADRAAAEAFVEFLQTPPAKKCFKRCGFQVPR